LVDCAGEAFSPLQLAAATEKVKKERERQIKR